MFGTEKIKELLDYGFSLVTRIGEITDDDSSGGKKVTWTEVLGSINLIAKIPRLFSSAGEMYKEWLDLDPGEIAELKAYFADKFDLEDDRIEKIFEEVWVILLGIGNLVKLLKKV